jgi:DNA-binding NarL/FixJ family response regulator
MTADDALRVLVVDDHDLFRTGLRALLEQEGFAVSDARSGEAAIAGLSSFQPDVVVMDLNMPGMSGIEATRRVLEASAGASVVMLTVNRDDERVLEALRAGASGYLLKDAELDEIIDGITAAAGGQLVLGPMAAGAVVGRLRDAPSAEAVGSGLLPALSEREREVLGLVARGCDNATIASRLFVSTSTVKHHVSRILHKLGVENRLQAAALAIRHGLADEERRRP